MVVGFFFTLFSIFLSDEMIDEYLTKRYDDPRLAEKIVRQYKRVPSIQILARHPFIAWQVASVFSDCFSYPDYGSDHPRLTPFLIRFMIVQINRKLRFYHNKKNNDLVFYISVKMLSLYVFVSFVMSFFWPV